MRFPSVKLALTIPLPVFTTVVITGLLLSSATRANADSLLVGTTLSSGPVVMIGSPCGAACNPRENFGPLGGYDIDDRGNVTQAFTLNVPATVTDIKFEIAGVYQPGTYIDVGLNQSLVLTFNAWLDAESFRPSATGDYQTLTSATQLQLSPGTYYLHVFTMGYGYFESYPWGSVLNTGFSDLAFLPILPILPFSPVRSRPGPPSNQHSPFLSSSLGDGDGSFHHPLSDSDFALLEAQCLNRIESGCLTRWIVAERNSNGCGKEHGSSDRES